MTASLIPTAGDGKLYPLSFQQQTTLLAEQFSPGAVLNPKYVVYLVLRLKGPLRYESLQAAFEDVVDEAALRSRLVLGPDGEVVQEELSGVRAPVELEDVGAGEAGLPALLERLADTRIPTDVVPLVRASVHRLGPDNHAVFLGLNRLTCDATGLYLAAEDLAPAYEARLEGRRLPPLAQSYGEYSKWQVETYASRLERDAPFWGEYVAGLQPYEVRQNLPFEPGAVGGGGACVRLPLFGPQEFRDLERFATRHRVTTLVSLLAGFHAVLGHRATSEDRLSVTYFEQRDHPSTREMVGFFLSPARSARRSPGPCPSPMRFRRCSRTSSPRIGGPTCRRRITSPRIQRWRRPSWERALPGSSSCYQPRSGSQSYRFGDARGSILRAGAANRQEPGMSLRLRRAEDGELWLRIGYDPRQWRAESMDALADRYGRALRAMVEDPSRTPARLLELTRPW